MYNTLWSCIQYTLKYLDKVLRVLTCLVLCYVLIRQVSTVTTIYTSAMLCTHTPSVDTDCCLHNCYILTQALSTWYCTMLFIHLHTHYCVMYAYTLQYYCVMYAYAQYWTLLYKRSILHAIELVSKHPNAQYILNNATYQACSTVVCWLYCCSAALNLCTNSYAVPTPLNLCCS